MRIKQLIEELEKQDPEKDVVVHTDSNAIFNEANTTGHRIQDVSFTAKEAIIHII